MSPGEGRRGERGALAVVALLLLLPLLRGALGAPPPCESAAGRVERRGRTVEVACGRPGAPLRGPARLLFGQAIDVNRATAGTLEVLPGIGPRRAEAIVRERHRRPFEGLEALERVSGIGPRTVEGLAGRVVARLDGPSAQPALGEAP